MSSGCRGQGTGTGAVDGRGAAGGDLCGGGAALHLDSGRGPRDPHAPRDSCTLSGCTVRGAGLGSSRSPRWEVRVKVGRLYPGTHSWPRRCPPGAPLQPAIPQPRGPRGPWCSPPTGMSLSLRRREWVFWFGTCAPLPLAPWQGVLWAHREGCDRPRGRPGEARPASSPCGRRAPVRGLPVPCSASGAQTDHTPPGRLEWGQGTAGLYTD